ncbi:EamA family transporter (plasmid) [Pedobacter sp. BS3]|uniref:DMT family transporter n=1 Tax=Pedobacter sp. BS3 TaxID=2567937 RepID=UPI0011EE5AFB|nr:EamA family transporter [Pedobacter sp. BS3]TZF85858.1 EamA family transporter [Pedobacter sp. BS3]
MVSTRENTKAYLALAVVCIVWGTTYFAMWIGVTTFPPLLFSGIRHSTAGVLLIVYLYISGKLSTLTKINLVRQAVPGVLMIALGNGVMGWSERYIPSGLAALITSVMPVYVTLINFAANKNRTLPNKHVLLGLLLGCIGIVLIFRDNLKDLNNQDYFTGIVVAFLACLAWAFGNIYTKFKPTTTPALVNAAIQLCSGGFFLVIMGLLFDDLNEIHHVSASSWYALIYLIIIGSLFTYTCFLYALERLPVTLVSIYAYINPFIALLLGALFLNERMTWVTWLALIVTLSGVYWINKGYKKH